jgi:SIR2-like domain
VLFIGAGLSFLSKNMSGEGLPDGRSLIDVLLGQPPGTGSPHPLERVAGHVVRTKGVDFLYDLLRNRLTVKSVDPILLQLYNLPWRRIYTTNYDDAIETALKGRRPISPVTLDDEIANAGPGSVIHLNGAIGRVSSANLQTGLVLTDYSYATSRLIESEWYKFFLRDLRSARALIFAGYSLADVDIQRALISEEFITKKSFFFISPKADQLETDVIADYGTLVSGGVDVGELASGKTTSALNVSNYLIGDGYRIFYAIKGTTLADELRKISAYEDKIAVVFENYISYRDEIREYVSRRPQQQRIILTERAVAHDLNSDFIEKTPHLGSTFEVRLDRIELADVPQFEALVNFGGFWGERAGASEAARQRIITKELEGSLYKLLVEIIKSEKVQSEIRGLLAPLSQDRKATKLIICSFIVNTLGFRFSINDWQAVFDGQWVRRIMRQYREQVRHFLSLEGDTIFPRAGVLSTHILGMFADDDIIRESLVDLYARASRSGDSDPEFGSMRISLTRYGSIEPIFSGRNKASNIFKYYDDIRVFGETRNNPDYWLQVGIAATVHDNLEAAETAFKNAYSREKARRRPNLKKIDNYFSRFEMRKAVEENDSKEAFAIFARANERLKKQIFLEENRHYPFKTGRYYADIAAKHYMKWNEAQKAQFLTEAKEIRERAIEWKRSQREFSVDVEILITETTRLIDRIERGGGF